MKKKQACRLVELDFTFDEFVVRSDVSLPPKSGSKFILLVFTCFSSTVFRE